MPLALCGTISMGTSWHLLLLSCPSFSGCLSATCGWTSCLRSRKATLWGTLLSFFVLPVFSPGSLSATCGSTSCSRSRRRGTAGTERRRAPAPDGSRGGRSPRYALRHCAWRDSWRYSWQRWRGGGGAPGTPSGAGAGAQGAGPSGGSHSERAPGGTLGASSPPK